MLPTGPSQADAERGEAAAEAATPGVRAALNSVVRTQKAAVSWTGDVHGYAKLVDEVKPVAAAPPSAPLEARGRALVPTPPSPNKAQSGSNLRLSGVDDYGIDGLDGQTKDKSLVKLQRYVRAVIQEWLASCSPITFRVNDPRKPYPLTNFADHGMIQFPARPDLARFIHLTGSREPYRSHTSYCTTVLDLMEKHWQMEPASVLISITGGAQDFKLQPRLLKAFKHGLAKAAQATNAWVFTGGTDSGVMQLVGEALSETQSSAKMIGVVTWACVWGKERLEGCYGATRDVVKENANDANHANLEPHHTHFILVDCGASPQEAWREALSMHLAVPKAAVSLSVRGSDGKSKPPFEVIATIAAASEFDGVNVSNRLRKLTAASASAVLPADSPIAEILRVAYSPTTHASVVHCVLAPSVVKFDDNTKWGSEIEMRANLEKLYCERRRVPRVMVVVNGGPGTLTTVHAAVLGGCPVVIISDSEGIATCLHLYIQAYSSSSEAGMLAWEKRYEREYGKDPKVWAQRKRVMLEIAEEDAAKSKIRSFSLSETSTAALDLHLLNAVINDDMQCRAGSRLQLAVQWNRKEVVQSVMLNLRSQAPGHDADTAENYVRVQVAQAMQIAIERQQADIIKMLFTAQDKAVGLLDFLSLYRVDHPIFATSQKLQAKLAEGVALDAYGKPTPITLYISVLLPFLEDFIPGIGYALKREQREAYARSKSARESQKNDANYFGDGVPHLMLWAVFIGSVELARVFWQQGTPQSDPIRLALIACQVSKEAAKMRPASAQVYLENAAIFESWAVSVLDKCSAQNQATIVLMRPSRTWPGTILQAAMGGENKSFVGHKYVQTLIDEYWRGNLYGSDGSLPANVGSWRVLLHLFFPTLQRQPVDHDVNAFDASRRLKTDRTHTFDLHSLVQPHRGTSEHYAPNNTMTHPPGYVPGQVGKSFTRGTTAARGMFDGEAPLKPPNGSRYSMNQVDTALDELPGCCQNPCRDGVLCFPLRCVGCCFNCCFQCCTCLTCLKCARRLMGAASSVGSVFRWTQLRWYLAVPRVKFLLKITSYLIFMILYTLVLISHPGTFLTFGVLEFIFAFYCYAFWVEELFQWYTHWCAGHDHFESFANIADVATLTSQVIASTIRLTAGVACHTMELGVHTVDRVMGDDRRLDEESLFAGLGGFGGYGAADDPAGAYSGGRRLIGNTPGLMHGLPLAAEGEDTTADMVWDGLYLGCTPLWLAQVTLALCAIYAYTRMMLWLQIYREVGVLSIIIQALFKDIVMFGGILVVVMAAFASAFVALMPSLGDTTFGTDGAFSLPFWAMFGEFGDLHDVGLAGGRLGPCLLWIFSFTTQVVLVNLLIAMMSETYEKIKENADNEWKYSRVFVVDEFVASVYWIPPPLSLPFLVLDMTHGFGKLFGHQIGYAVARCRRSLANFRRRGTRNANARGALQLPYATPLRRMSTTRATGLGYRPEANVVPLLSDTLPWTVLELQPPDMMWLADVLEDEERKVEGATETKIERLSSELSKVLDKSLEIQESLMNLHKIQGEDSYGSGAGAVGGGAGGGGTAESSRQTSFGGGASPRGSDVQPARGVSPSHGRSPVLSAFTSGGSTDAINTVSPRGSAGATARGSSSAVVRPIARGARIPAASPRGDAAAPATTLAPPAKELSTVREGGGFASRSLVAGPSAAPLPRGATLAAPPALSAVAFEELKAKLAAAEAQLRGVPPPHTNARSQQNPMYPPRVAVPDAQVPWRACWAEYEPVAFTSPVVVANARTKSNPNGWADASDPTTVRDQLTQRVSFEGAVLFDARGRPVNPRGRTGICMRGMLGKWGPNHAADPIVTRWKPEGEPSSSGGSKPVLQIVAIRRGDTGRWALPGGMVDAGEVVSVTVRREFEEEAGNVKAGEEREAFSRAVEELFSNGRVVYRGYVDDPRNTDNAWMETTAFHFHCSAELGQHMPLGAGDDAADVAWLDADASEERFANLYASHREWVEQVALQMGPQAPAPAPTPSGQLKPQKSQRGVFGFGARKAPPTPTSTPPPSPPGSPLSPRPGSPRPGSRVQ